MVLGLIDLGLNMAQILASIFTNIIVNNVRDVASSSIKSQAIHAEHIRRVLCTDINEIKEKINSMAQSRLLAAFDYVKRGIIVLQGIIPSNGFAGSSDKEIVEYYNLRKPKIEELIQDAKRFFLQADIWATEAFNDKANVTIPMRLEAIRIQLFCTMMLHWDKPQQWLEMWRSILQNMIRDKGVSQTMLTFNPWLSKRRKQEIKSTLSNVSNETVNALWKLAYEDMNLATFAGDTITFLKSPPIMAQKYYKEWQDTIAVTENIFFPWQNHLVAFLPECCRMAVLPENNLCVIDRQFKFKFLDAINLQPVTVKTLPFRPDKEYSSVAFDKSQSLILTVQFKPNVLLLFNYVNLHDVSFKQSIDLPEEGYTIMCTNDGHWIFRGISGKVYVQWYGKGDWVKIIDHVNKIFDVQDTSVNSIRILTDVSIEYLYPDTASDPSCVVSNKEDLNLLSIFGNNRLWNQSVTCFDDESLIVAHRMEESNKIRLSYLYRKNDEFSSVYVSDIFPVRFEEPIELLMVKDKLIYIGTMRSFELTSSMDKTVAAL